mgnify:CR=1 FL=1
MSKSVNHALYSTNIYGSEWTILKTIHDQGTMTQTALANYLNIEPAAISKTIRQLMKKNLIMRQRINVKNIFISHHWRLNNIMNGLKLSLKIVAEY